jgi:hypothetical protein
MSSLPAQKFPFPSLSGMHFRAAIALSTGYCALKINAAEIKARSFRKHLPWMSTVRIENYCNDMLLQSFCCCALRSLGHGDGD